MKILIDGDACPVVRLTEQIAAAEGIPVIIFCDTNHVIESAYSEVKTIGAGADAVDFALIQYCTENDIVVTQDYGVAALGLGKKAFPIHQSGMLYTDENMDALLNERYLAKRARASSSKHHMKGPRKRTVADDQCFAQSLRQLINKIRSRSEE